MIINTDETLNFILMIVSEVKQYMNERLERPPIYLISLAKKLNVQTAALLLFDSLVYVCGKMYYDSIGHKFNFEMIKHQLLAIGISEIDLRRISESPELKAIYRSENNNFGVVVMDFLIAEKVRIQ